MSRYIDAETLKVSILRYAKTFLSHKRLPITKRVAEEVINDVCFAIDVQDSVDVVPVVRCKDCKHWLKTTITYEEGDPVYTCPKLTMDWGDEDGYCFMGEKVSE